MLVSSYPDILALIATHQIVGGPEMMWPVGRWSISLPTERREMLLMADLGMPPAAKGAKHSGAQSYSFPIFHAKEGMRLYSGGILRRLSVLSYSQTIIFWSRRKPSRLIRRMSEGCVVQVRHHVLLCQPPFLVACYTCRAGCLTHAGFGACVVVG